MNMYFQERSISLARFDARRAPIAIAIRGTAQAFYAGSLPPLPAIL
jgi:hypothetical protein